MRDDPHEYVDVKSCQKVVLKRDNTTGMCHDVWKRTYKKGSELFLLEKGRWVSELRDENDNKLWDVPNDAFEIVD